jgi:four helix bundle protein
METAPQTESRAGALEERLVDFAVGIIPIANQLSDSFAGRHLAGQIIRSGTSAAPNYAEARSAESRADFIHKLRIAIKELNETAVWLQIITKAKLLPGTDLNSLTQECGELRRIIGASLRTARLRAGGQPRRDGPISNNQ